MSETLLQLVGGAAVTGFGFLAYNHPTEYRLLSPFLAAISFFIGAVMFAWLMAVQQCELAAASLVSGRDYDQLRNALQTLKPSLWLIEGIGLGGPVLFGPILSWIGTLKKQDE